MTAHMGTTSVIRSGLFGRNQWGRRRGGLFFPPVAAAERLETNTSVGHMIPATLCGPGEPRVRIPVKTVSGLPFPLTDSPNHAGVSCTSAIAAAAHLGAARHLAQKESFVH
jgi:hypothetical protein